MDTAATSSGDFDSMTDPGTAAGEPILCLDRHAIGSEPANDRRTRNRQSAGRYRAKKHEGLQANEVHIAELNDGLQTLESKLEKLWNEKAVDDRKAAWCQYRAKMNGILYWSEEDLASWEKTKGKRSGVAISARKKLTERWEEDLQRATKFCSSLLEGSAESAAQSLWS